MKLISAVLALAVFAGVASDAEAHDRRVRIINASSYDIYEFYASNTGTNSWKEDILGRNILPAGSSVVIDIDDGSGYCRYDFLAVFEDGDEVISGSNNVCQLAQFTFTD
jgi:hypothetical protein